MLVVGSVPVRNVYQREPKDLDIIGTFEELGELTKKIRTVYPGMQSIPLNSKKTVLLGAGDKPIEFEIAWPGSSGAILTETTNADRFAEAATLYPSWRGIVLKGTTGISAELWETFNLEFAELNELYWLKMSHRYLKNSKFFLKTMEDIHALRERITPEMWIPKSGIAPAWFKLREEETYSYNHPKLNTTKKSFFSTLGQVKYIYDHDSIHRAMAQGKVPAYELYKGEGEVLSSKKKFFELPEEVRLHGVLEEAYVLALERSQIPYGKDGLAPTWSFEKALEKVCTSITSGWFREFAWENYYKVRELYDPGYVDEFWAAVKNGVVIEANDHRSDVGGGELSTG